MKGIFVALIFLTLSVGLVLASLSVPDAQVPDAFFGGDEQDSPGDWISEDQIKVYKDQVVLDIPGATWARFTDTNSMDPFLDETANAIEISPESPYDIQVGDVISYYSGDRIIIHRVIAVAEDELGPYYLVKGDNNNFRDSTKVRFDDIYGVVVAIIY